MEKKESKFMQWWNAAEKKDFKSLLFGRDTLVFIVAVLITSFLVAATFFIVQMCSAERETEETVAFVGVCIITLVGLWRALSNMRKLSKPVEMVCYALIAAVLGYLIFQLAMLLFIVFIVLLVIGFLNLGKFNLVEALFPKKGTAHEGLDGDDFISIGGKDLKITENHGDGFVRTEDGRKFQVDGSGNATEI